LLIEGNVSTIGAKPAGSVWPSVRLTHVYLGLAWAVFLGVAAYFVSVTGSTIADDAYITLTYARNLASGEGLVWAGGVKVEGYTDFLWVLIGAAAFKLDVDPVVMYRIVGISAGAGLLAAVWAWNERYSVAEPWARLAPVLLAAMGPIAYWAIAGLEATAYASLAFIATLAGLIGGRYAIVSGVLFFLAALAHPDAVVLFAPVSGYVLLKARRDGTWREAFGLILAFAVPFGLYWIARWAYFGYPMPNTFYAKDTFSWEHIEDGFAYMRSFAPLAGYFAAFLILRGLMKGLRDRPQASLLAVQLGLWLAYMLYVGGDFMELSRFLVPILPAFALLLQESGWIVATQARFRKTAFGVSGAIAVAASVLWVSGMDFTNARVPIRDGWKDMGLWLKAHSSPDDLIAVTAAGAIPFYSERPAIDMLGLNDVHIAHHGKVDDSMTVAHKRSDGAYVLDREPVFIVVNNIVEQGQPLTGNDETVLENGMRMIGLTSNAALFEDERFWTQYTRVRIVGMENHHVLVVSNGYVEELERRGAVETVEVVGGAAPLP
jgi:arabinofuranosyltransferase